MRRNHLGTQFLLAKSAVPSSASRFATSRGSKNRDSSGIQHRGCSLRYRWKVDLELVKAWLLDLDALSYEQVVAAVELLGEHGPQLGRPLVDTVVGSRHRNMKELRPGSSGRTELRILFAFDPERNVILLVAGDKAGNWKKWYRDNIPVADDRIARQLKRLRGGT